MSNKQMYVKPVEGLIVRMPPPQTSLILADKGGWVPCNRYWRAQLREGSVLVVDPRVEPMSIGQVVENKVPDKLATKRTR